MARSMTPEKAEELGRYLLWFKSPLQSSDCLITAHGGYYKNMSSFRLGEIAPGGEISVKFYGAHGNVLSDPGLGLLSKRPVVLEEYPNNVEGDKVVDYVLSKYQGRHSAANETYASIEHKLATDGPQKKQFEDLHESDRVLDDPALKDIYDSLVSCHIVTVRNRWNKSDISLKYVIKTVHEQKPGIRNFHCSFCRSLIGDEHAQTSQVQSRRSAREEQMAAQNPTIVLQG